MAWFERRLEEAALEGYSEMAAAVRDVRVLRDALLAHSD
jgi:hypothetical protein